MKALFDQFEKAETRPANVGGNLMNEADEEHHGAGGKCASPQRTRTAAKK